MNNYALERLLPSQWEEYKAIRLQALQTNPETFGSTFVKEAAYTQDDWISLLENQSRAVFALYYSTSIIGLCGVAVKKEDRATAILFSAFIKIPFRGKGLSKMFYQTRIDWARQQGCTSITVSHRIGNERSKAANQRFGFKFSYANEVTWPDGLQEDELIYALQLSP